MKLKLYSALLVGILAGLAQAQELARAVEPIRLSIAEEADAGTLDKEFNSLLRAELGKGREYRFTHTRFDAKILTASTPVVERGRQVAVSSAVAVLRRGPDGYLLRLHVVSAPTVDGAAKDAGAWLRKELTR